MLCVETEWGLNPFVMNDEYAHNKYEVVDDELSVYMS